MELNEKQKKMVEKFKWNEGIQESGTSLEEYEFVQELENCVKTIYKYSLKNMETKHFLGDAICVPIEISIHSLLEKSFSDDWSLESRLKLLEVLGYAFSGYCLFSSKEITKKMNSLFPSPDYFYVLLGVYLKDNPSDFDVKLEVEFKIHQILKKS